AATGTNCTAQTIEATRRAEALGASAALVTVPYYSKPGQKGILHHFGELAAVTNLPLIIVNDPARTASPLLPSTLDVLSADGTIFGLLDIEGD
ncbi:dihydrodipicolinate synthase family protein, partial [Arthrobacter sp. SIMBA_036]|uniref:dihydrodipicolinate synthase family protein n=1 Tax=Arthrobacter sp. SIMBA_036 TaxID=3085778 RepID=UPI00397D78B7